MVIGVAAVHRDAGVIGHELDDLQHAVLAGDAGMGTCASKFCVGRSVCAKMPSSRTGARRVLNHG